MIIREYKKNLMIVKNIDSDIIGEAYFILKDEKADISDEHKIADEAERIIRECSPKGNKKTRRRLSAALIGIFSGLGLCALITAIAFLAVQLSM